MFLRSALNGVLDILGVWCRSLLSEFKKGGFMFGVATEGLISVE